MNFPRSIVPILLSCTFSFACAAQNARVPATADAPYIFAWPFIETSDMSPRGGTTRGEKVALQTAATTSWKAIQRTDATPLERDRAAILAMAGEYRVSFDFLETVVFEPPFEPAKPYRSWATEKVYIIEDRKDFISLQHILEMYVVDADGKRQGPFVQKHWRQDWAYQPANIYEYRGGELWARADLSAEEREGRWSQSVFQVDDSPRYAAVGQWQHTPSFSSWTSGPTLRPLPRRERSVRSDYDNLRAINRHTILPLGWVHEEDNLKTAGSGDKEITRAREVGVNRYQPLAEFDFRAADEYWQATAPFWQDVRTSWTERFDKNSELQIRKKCDGTSAFMKFFEFAQKLQSDAPPSAEARRAFIEKTLDCITQ
ncbi:MAG: hypothetical protein P8K76_08815 [Candidatus Binatia bacterium]|nr:hypothetical protein [Candidatus Binatia bacterium]MDG2009865.1 hypothetical protein [Candidatus Binatia bacterium]